MKEKEKDILIFFLKKKLSQNCPNISIFVRKDLIIKIENLGHR